MLEFTVIVDCKNVNVNMVAQQDVTDNDVIDTIIKQQHIPKQSDQFCLITRDYLLVGRGDLTIQSYAEWAQNEGVGRIEFIMVSLHPQEDNFMAINWQERALYFFITYNEVPLGWLLRRALSIMGCVNVEEVMTKQEGSCRAIVSGERELADIEIEGGLPISFYYAPLCIFLV